MYKVIKLIATKLSQLFYFIICSIGQFNCNLIDSPYKRYPSNFVIVNGATTNYLFYYFISMSSIIIKFYLNICKLYNYFKGPTACQFWATCRILLRLISGIFIAQERTERFLKLGYEVNGYLFIKLIRSIFEVT